jgi:hypothetical protein
VKTSQTNLTFNKAAFKCDGKCDCPDCKHPGFGDSELDSADVTDLTGQAVRLRPVGAETWPVYINREGTVIFGEDANGSFSGSTVRGRITEVRAAHPTKWDVAWLCSVDKDHPADHATSGLTSSYRDFRSLTVGDVVCVAPTGAVYFDATAQEADADIAAKRMRAALKAGMSRLEAEVIVERLSTLGAPGRLLVVS